MTTDTTTPDAWNADTSPFDPVRAGFKGDCPHFPTVFTAPTPHGFLDLIPAEAVDQWYAMSYFGSTIHRDFFIPRTMPDGTPRTHADVISILRANGWNAE